MSLLELLEHVELITYLASFEFYTPHLGVLKGAAAFLLTLFCISLTHCCTKSLPKNCKSTDEDQWWYAIGTVHKRYMYTSLSHATNNICRRMTQAHLNSPPRQILLACNLNPECSQNDVLLYGQNARKTKL